MNMYYVSLFMHLHVSVPLDHLQGAFCYIICHKVHVQYTSIYNSMYTVLYVKNVTISDLLKCLICLVYQCVCCSVFRWRLHLNTEQHTQTFQQM
jgi:hypothetical protein